MPANSTGLPVHKSYRPEKEKKKKKKKEEEEEEQEEEDLSFFDETNTQLYGFGSIRYGVLGVIDEKQLESSQPDDYFERFTTVPQPIEGFCGTSVHSIVAGESHFSVLIDHVPVKGGVLASQGLATLGRLGIGGARRELTRRQIKARQRDRNRDQHALDDEDGDDFTSLPFERTKLRDGTVIEDQNARFLPNPRAARCNKVMQASCGQCHNACVTEEGQVFVWGSNRHGRLGYVSLNALPYDTEDENDCYASTPVALDFPGGRVKYISCGLKHTVACDERGQVWAWGLARYGRLGTGAFESLPREAPDVHGFVDDHSYHQPYPVEVKGLSSIFVSKVFAGAYNSFALAGGSNGSPSTVWGLARYGLLGVGDYPTQCCYERLVDPGVPADECPSCKRTQVEKVPGILSYVEETRGHPAFSRCQLTRPRETQVWVDLPSDPEDPMDTYMPSPVEVTKFQAQNVVHVYPGHFHALALTDDGKVFGWGLLRHGRCGVGKFDPNSSWSDELQRLVFDKSCPTYPKERVFEVTAKGVVKAATEDETSWYEPSPALLGGLREHQVVDLSVSELHGVATMLKAVELPKETHRLTISLRSGLDPQVTVEGRVFTWGVGRHGRLGLKDGDTEFLVDPADAEGAYVASPEEVVSTRDLKIFKVACTAASTLMAGSQLLAQSRARPRRRSSMFGRRNSIGTGPPAKDPNPVYRLLDVGTSLVARFSKNNDDSPREDNRSATCVVM